MLYDFLITHRAELIEHCRGEVSKRYAPAQVPQVVDLAVKRHAAITTDEFRTLNRCLDEAIADAVTAFGDERENALPRSGDAFA
jgi:hypothetical protein